MHPTSGNDLSGLDNGLDEAFADLVVDEDKEGELVNQVQDLVTTLIDAVDRDAHADRGLVPQGRVPQPIVVLDSVQYNTFGPENLNVQIGDNIDGGIVELIINCGGHDFNTADLQTHVSTIKKVYRPQPAHTRPPAVTVYEDAIVQQLTACEPSLAKLRAFVGNQNLDIPLPQAAAVICFLTTYSWVWPQLQKANVKVKFNAHRSESRGGGLFMNNKIYMSTLRVTPAGAFIRLFVHEIGHALFERRLLGDKPMPNALVEDKLTSLKNVGQTTTPRERIKECAEIQSFWNNMSVQAKSFYQAWRTLRQNSGEYLLGIDLWADPQGHRLCPTQRRQYQAKHFGEFCAEVFMLYAMGDLQAHVVAVLSNDNIPRNVRTAWKNAWHVLENEAASILGPRSD